MGFLITCPICHGDFKDGRSHTATSGVAFPPPHPLYEYCDAGLHLECMETWPHRVEFSRGYFLEKRGMFEAMGTLLGEGSGWILGCGPAPIGREPYYAEIDLEDWPFRLYCNWHDWEAFLAGGYGDGLTGIALEAAHSVVSQVRNVAPDLSSLASVRRESLLAPRPNNSFKPKPLRGSA